MNRSRDGPSANSVSTVHTHTLSLLTAPPESVLWSAIVPLHRLLLPPLQTTWSVSGTCPQKNRLIPRPHSETPFRDPIPRPRPFRDWPSPLLRAGEESSKSWSELSRLSFLTCMTEFSIIDSINMMMWIVVGSYWKFELGNCFWLMNWYMMNCLLKRLQPWSSFLILKKWAWSFEGQRSNYTHTLLIRSSEVDHLDPLIGPPKRGFDQLIQFWSQLQFKRFYTGHTSTL